MDTNNNVTDLYLLGSVNDAAKAVASAQCQDTTAIVQGIAGTNLLNMASNERLNIAIDDSVYKASMDNRDAIERNADINRDSTERNAVAVALAVERNGSANITATQIAENEITNLVERSTNEIESAQQAIALETRQQLGEHHYTVISMEKDAVINDNKNASAVELQATTNLYKVETELVSVDNTLQLQAVQNTAQIQFEAVKQNAELAAQAEECCCELKEEVMVSNFTTQQTARQIETTRLRDQLAAAATENLVARLRYRYRSPSPCRSRSRSRSQAC